MVVKGTRDALLEKVKKSDLKMEESKILKIAKEIEIAMFGKIFYIGCLFDISCIYRNVW